MSVLEVYGENFTPKDIADLLINLGFFNKGQELTDEQFRNISDGDTLELHRGKYNDVVHAIVWYTPYTGDVDIELY